MTNRQNELQFLKPSDISLCHLVRGVSVSAEHWRVLPFLFFRYCCDGFTDAETGAPVFSEITLSFLGGRSLSHMLVRFHVSLYTYRHIGVKLW